MPNFAEKSITMPLVCVFCGFFISSVIQFESYINSSNLYYRKEDDAPVEQYRVVAGWNNYKQMVSTASVSLPYMVSGGTIVKT